jgi:hypothetical protein
MGRQPMNKSTLGTGRDVHAPDPRIERSRRMRAEQALLAAQNADRAEQARADGQYDAMRHWMREYRRATMRCRQFGERIRSQDINTAPETANGDPAVAAFAPRSALDHPLTGEAA